MKKTNLHLWVLGALLCGLSLTVTSCKDDDKKVLSPEEEEQLGMEVQNQWNDAFAVIDELANTDNADENFLTQTFEPAIGMADGTDEGTRIVNTNSMELAAERFAQLANVSINENTQSYNWSNEQLGTMTYTKSTDGKSWATVDVDIKQVPHLHKIIYRSPEQADNNAKFSGRAYYRFGDVVSRTVKNKDGSTVKEYWICVRPAFGIEGKEDSHWVCVNAVPQKNIYSYTYTFDKKTVDERTQTWYVPTGLGKNKEHMQNLAEMLYAMLYPEKWQANIDNKANPNLIMFHDFDKKNAKYHNMYFWSKVCQAWDNIVSTNNGQDLWHNVFNTSKEALKAQFDDDNGGLRLLYKGYSWYSSTSWNCQLWEAIYTKGTGNNSNMHAASLVEPKHSMEKIKFNCHTMGDAKENYSGFFGDNYLRFCIRHATGKELAQNGRYDVRQPISGVAEVYRYYHDVEECTDLLNNEPEETIDDSYPSNAPTDGSGTYMFGDVLEDEHESRWFCITGSPVNPGAYQATDHTAWFVSFDGFDQWESYAVNDLVTEQEMPEFAAHFVSFLNTLRTMRDEYQLSMERDGALGKVGQHILDYAGVDLRQFASRCDSVWTFTNYKDKQQYNSRSTTYILNLAYDDGVNDIKTFDTHQPIARLILDKTQAGTERAKCDAKSGKKIDTWRCLCYKHYETYDPDRITLTEDEQSVGMTKWQALWPVSTDKMLLQDVAKQSMVDKYAKTDKWQKHPRTRAEDKDMVEPHNYSWLSDIQKFKNDELTSLHKERVLFMRLMKVTDNGGKIPNLVSQDGRKLSIVHLQNDKLLYSTCCQASWVINYLSFYKERFFLDNKHHALPAIPGIDL